MIEEAQKQVEEFITVVKQEELGKYPGYWLSEQSKQLCRKLIEEETEELLEAIDYDDWPEIIDGAADTIFVVLYLMAKTGINLESFWQEVCKTNLAKAGGPKDPVTGKQLKPEGWKPPNIEKMLEDVRLGFIAIQNPGKFIPGKYVGELKMVLVDPEKIP